MESVEQIPLASAGALRDHQITILITEAVLVAGALALAWCGHWCSRPRGGGGLIQRH